MSILYVLLLLLVVGILWWGASTILNAPGIVIAEPIKTILYVIIVVLLCLFLIQAIFGVVPGIPHLRL